MFQFIVRFVCFSVFGTSLALLSACSTVDSASARLASVVTPYKLDIVQGNFISSEQAAALKVGMNRAQVKNILGTPLLTDIFHANQWDYVFTFKRQGAPYQARRITVYFKDGLLTQVAADALPSEAEFVASLDSGRKTGPVPVLEMSQDSLKVTVKPALQEQTKPPPILPASYPPLEAPVR